MAGGPQAAIVPCYICLDDHTLTPAHRVHEGQESDVYRCARGHDFSIDWARGPATEPQWPPPDDLRRDQKAP